MALENISNAPEVCSDMLRIAPGALHIQTFLGGGPPKPPSLPPIKCQNRSEDTKISKNFLGVSGTWSHLTPPWEKILDPPLICMYELQNKYEVLHLLNS